ncbi:MAG: topoisomerase [Chloroflexota bacterium]|jgi:DNA topoisomerase-1
MTATERARDPAESAKSAGLRYVNDKTPGIRREQAGDGFRYFGPKGDEITDEEQLKRFRSLAIPPAYTDVWICPDPRGHIQATGRDAKGRKQYRYHPRWHAVRDESKYHRTIAFGRALPGIRARVDQDLKRPGIPREKVLAALVRLLETTLIRVGNDEYARTNKSFGLTTIRDKHVEVNGATVRFKFRGKSGKFHTIDLRDRRLATIVRRSKDLPGQELFQYEDDDGNVVDITSDDVNAYLREIAGEEFTAKDFRTWAGTVLAAQTLQSIGGADTKKAIKAKVKEAIESVAERLGNTPSICRKCYVHPVVLEAYMDGTLVETLAQAARQEFMEDGTLDPEEQMVLNFLESKVASNS